MIMVFMSALHWQKRKVLDYGYEIVSGSRRRCYPVLRGSQPGFVEVFIWKQKPTFTEEYLSTTTPSGELRNFIQTGKYFSHGETSISDMSLGCFPQEEKILNIFFRWVSVDR